MLAAKSQTIYSTVKTMMAQPVSDNLMPHMNFDAEEAAVQALEKHLESLKRDSIEYMLVNCRLRPNVTILKHGNPCRTLLKVAMPISLISLHWAVLKQVWRRSLTNLLDKEEADQTLKTERRIKTGTCLSVGSFQYCSKAVYDDRSPSSLQWKCYR